MIQNILLFFLVLHVGCLMQASLNPMRQLLKDVRHGAYAHPGDEEILDRIFVDLQDMQVDVQDASVVDLGCGLGGTIGYLQSHGCTQLFGLDIDAAAIAYGRQQWPDIDFTIGSVFDVGFLYVDHSFDVIMLLSVIYSMQDKRLLFEEITKVAHVGTVLVLFDYAVGSGAKQLAVTDFNDRAMLPIDIKNCREDLCDAGWSVMQVHDCSDDFARWYHEFLEKLDTQHDMLQEQYGKQVYDVVRSIFSYFYEQIKRKQLGGVLIYAIKN